MGTTTNQEKHADELYDTFKDMLIVQKEQLMKGAIMIGSEEHKLITRANALKAKIENGNFKPEWYNVLTHALKYLDHAEVQAIPFALPVSNIVRAIKSVMKQVES